MALSVGEGGLTSSTQAANKDIIARTSSSFSRHAMQRARTSQRHSRSRGKQRYWPQLCTYALRRGYMYSISQVGSTFPVRTLFPRIIIFFITSTYCLEIRSSEERRIIRKYSVWDSSRFMYRAFGGKQKSIFLIFSVIRRCICRFTSCKFVLDFGCVVLRIISIDNAFSNDL